MFFNDKMENKKRRINDVSGVSDTQFVDELEQLPYLYRSIQAINWIKTNPFVVKDMSNIRLEFKSYIETIFIKFFSGIGFGYYVSDTSDTSYDIEEYLSDGKGLCKRIDFSFFNALPDSILKINYSTFVEYLRFSILENLIKQNIVNIGIHISIEVGICFSFTTYENNDTYGHLWYHKCDLRENKTTEQVKFF